MAEGNPSYARAPVQSGELRQTGISAIGDAPWGTHFCQFYEDKQDLIEILVPYFKAGLENDEFCMWITSEPLPSDEAKAALAASVDNLQRYIASGQLEVLDYGAWYTLGAEFQSERVLQSWLDRLEAAARRGFDGLRLTGNTFWLEKPDWHGFTEYEAAVDAIIGHRRIVAICTYMLSKCSALQIMDVISNHSSALAKRAGKWQVIQSSERKKVEANLHETEERVRMAVASTGLGTWDFDVATGRMVCSDLCKRHFGLPPDREVDFNTFLRGIHPDDRERVNKIMQEVLRSGSDRCFDAEYRTTGIEDGKERWITGMGRAFLDREGRPVCFLGTTLDITKRRRAETKLRESEELFRTVADTAPVMIWMSGLDKLRTFFNQSWLEFTGCTMEQELGTGWAEGVHPEDLDRCLAVYSSSFEARRRFQMEYRLRRADREHRLVLDSGTPLYREGEFAGYIGSCIDVTEARRAQEELFARQKLESLGTLASGIAHDFNNLLGGVMAQAELALEEYQAGSSPEEELKRIRDGAIRGSEIVRQLMIYAGKESEAVGLVDVSQVARGMIELLKVSISKHAALVTDFGEDLPAVRGSTGEIQQIVMNLVTNASEALDDRDGVIRISTRRVNLDRAEAISKGIAEGDYVQLEVSDTGRGMPLETQARVFDPFFTTKSQGHGLGLGVVRGIVRGLGGAIHLSSELGKGSTFQIFLRSTGIMTGTSGPLKPAGEPSPAPVAIILVVEDDDSLRVALAQILRRRGFETLDAANGADAINLLRANSIKIDMMLLDMTIPGPSSREVATVAAEARPGLKVVLTSAYDEKLVRSTVAATQACGFVRKPFQVDELVYTLRSTLSVRGTTG